MGFILRCPFLSEDNKEVVDQHFFPLFFWKGGSLLTILYGSEFQKFVVQVAFYDVHSNSKEDTTLTSWLVEGREE